MDGGYPQFPDIIVIGLAHLMPYQARLGRSQPQIIVRLPPVAQMIVDAASTAPALLLRVAQACQIAMIVVTPHEGDIFRHFESHLIEFEHFLVGDEYLVLLRWISHILR